MNILLSKLSFIILLVSCYDLYYPPFGRVLDYLSLFLILFYIVKKEFFYNYKIFLYLIAPFSFGILFFNDIKSVIGILFGITFGCVFYIYYKERESITPFLLVSIIMVLFFFIQLFTFKFFNFYIDFTSILQTIPSRNYIESIDYFRASGLFQEPNSYCVFAFMMVTILLYTNMQHRLKDLTIILLISTLMISNSLWGMVLSVGLIGLLLLRKKYKYVLSIVIILFVTQSIWLENRTEYRIKNVFIESTVQERYVGSKFTVINNEQLKKTFDEERHSVIFKIKNFILGYGSSSYGFQVKYGANGISYLLFNFGLFGLVIFLYYVYYLDNTKYKQKLIITLFLLTSYPYFTYALFWVWFVVMYLESIEKFKKRVVYC